MGNIQSTPDRSKNEYTTKFSHFRPEDVQYWLKCLEKNYTNTFLTEEDVEKIYTDLFPFGNCSNFVRQMFRTINIGSTGKLDFNEIFIAFSILTKGSKYEKLRWVFRFYDVDNDGVISKNEAQQLVRAMHDMFGNFLDLTPFSNASVEQVFELLENQSGFLTFEDFLRLVDKKPNVLQDLPIINKI